MTRRRMLPYVVGQWVCGPKFYGRNRCITELLGSPQEWHWIAGLRRIGKTSLLKQLEFLKSSNRERCLPLFWDLQGVDSVEDLGLTFCDALLDAQDALDRVGISLESVEDGELFTALRKLGSALRRRGGELLLLCDEVDEGVALEERHPGLAASLWQAVGGFGRARVVVASSLRLCDAAAVEGAAAQLMKPFRSPYLLGPLTDEEARSLLLQGQLPAPSQPRIEGAWADVLRKACGNHPMLLQIAGKRCLEIGDPEAAIRQMASDRAVQHLLAVDFELLSKAEQAILRGVATGGEDFDPADPSGPSGEAQRLVALGVLRRGRGGFEIPNSFLDSWLSHVI